MPNRIKSAGPTKPIPEFPVILGDFELLYLEEDRPKISCCYGVSVFAGLALALVVLTGLVVYAGFWYSLQMNGEATQITLSEKHDIRL